MKIILASNSPRRKELLSQIGVDFSVIPSEYEEKSQDMQPVELVKFFAYMKATDVYNTLKSQNAMSEDVLILGADTIVYCDEIMGKPKDEKDAFRMLKKLSGRDHYVITGISLIRLSDGKCITEHEQTLVKIKELTDQEIENYIATKEPADKAGAYGIQGIGSLLVQKIDGCYFNIVGLPIYKLSEVLKNFSAAVL